jgi:hypothetical protein
MVATRPIPQPGYAFVPWACRSCPTGNMVWFACDLRAGGALVEHKFACDTCNDIAHITLPFAPPPEAA